MKQYKVIVSLLSVLLLSLIISGCGNTSGSVSYSMGVGYGYPMYYGGGYRQNNVVVVRPPRGGNPGRPSRPAPRRR